MACHDLYTKAGLSGVGLPLPCFISASLLSHFDSGFFANPVKGIRFTFTGIAFSSEEQFCFSCRYNKRGLLQISATVPAWFFMKWLLTCRRTCSKWIQFLFRDAGYRIGAAVWCNSRTLSHLWAHPQSGDNRHCTKYPWDKCRQWLRAAQILFNFNIGESYKLYQLGLDF